MSRTGLEPMAARDQPGGNLLVIEDFAVEDDPQGLVLVRDGLVATRHVDNRQAAHSEPDFAVDVDAVIVGAPPHERVVHRSKHVSINGPLLQFENTDDSTHLGSLA